MNYIELDLGGKKRGAKLGISFLRYLDEEGGIKIGDVDGLTQGANSIIGIPTLIYHSLKFNSKRKGEVFDYSIDDIFEWIDDDGGLSNKSLKLFIENFTASLGADVGKTQPQAKVAKK